MKTWQVGVTLAVVGVAASGLAVSWLGRPMKVSARKPPDVGAEQVTRPSKTSAAIDLQAMQLSALNQRLSALEAASAAAPTKDAEHARDEARLVAPSAAEIEQQHDASVAAARAEPIDAQWSRRIAAGIRRDFAQLPSDVGATVKQVDCRSTSCIISLEWPSREVAVGQWRRVMHQPTEALCGRELVVPEGKPNENGPVEVSMLLDCAQWVAQGS